MPDIRNFSYNEVTWPHSLEMPYSRWMREPPWMRDEDEGAPGVLISISKLPPEDDDDDDAYDDDDDDADDDNDAYQRFRG